jgi:hypothetical protein
MRASNETQKLVARITARATGKDFSAAELSKIEQISLESCPPFLRSRIEKILGQRSADASTPTPQSKKGIAIIPKAATSNADEALRVRYHAIQKTEGQAAADRFYNENMRELLPQHRQARS